MGLCKSKMTVPYSGSPQQMSVQLVQEAYQPTPTTSTQDLPTVDKLKLHRAASQQQPESRKPAPIRKNMSASMVKDRRNDQESNEIRHKRQQQKGTKIKKKSSRGKDSQTTETSDNTPTSTPRFVPSDDSKRKMKQSQLNGSSFDIVEGTKISTHDNVDESHYQHSKSKHREEYDPTKVHTLAAAHERWKKSYYSREVRESSAVTIAKNENGNEVVNKYIMYEEIGHGAYGIVQRCISMEDGNTYAAKVLKKSFLKKQRIQRKTSVITDEESKIWKDMNHPNLVKLIEVINDDTNGNIFMISEFVNGGSLMPDQMEHEPIDEEDARYFFAQLVDGLSYMHEFNIAHRDIKPGNLLIKIPQKYENKTEFYSSQNRKTHQDEGPARSLLSQWTRSFSSDEGVHNHDTQSPKSPLQDAEKAYGNDPVQSASPTQSGTNRRSVAESHNMILKIGDFGVAQVFHSDDDFVRNTAGTASFQAPETLTGKHFSAKLSDVWAAGVTLFMLIYGKTPFSGTNLMQIYHNIKDSPLEFPDRPTVSEHAKNLISLLLNKDPKKRPSLKSLRYHRFLLKYNAGSFSIRTRPKLPALSYRYQSRHYEADRLTQIATTKIMVSQWRKRKSIVKHRRASIGGFPMITEEDDNSDIIHKKARPWSAECTTMDSHNS